MEEISRKSRRISDKIGVESFHGFGDCLFNIPLIQAISQHYNMKISVATKKQCMDAFVNIPFIDAVFHIGNIGDGKKLFENLRYRESHQITQNLWFPVFKADDDDFSLIDTAKSVGDNFGFEFDNNKPIIIPTDEDLDINLDLNKPIIAIESVYNSYQSWAKDTDFDLIVNSFASTHNIIWLSHGDVPKNKSIIDTKSWTRRKLIVALKYVDIFFSVGSGFFCGALSLPKEMQPRKIICMWIDNYYRYIDRLKQLQWTDDITWLQDSRELQNTILSVQSETK